MRFFNRVKFTTTTTGTGTITVGTAVTAFRTPAQAGIPDGAWVRYVIEDPAGSANWETGFGKYTVSGTTLTRNVLQSSNADAALNLSGSATVRITELAEDLVNTGPDGRMFYMDDFIGGTGTSGSIGQLGWQFTNGTLTPLDADGDYANHPGTVERSYNSTSNATCFFCGGAGAVGMATVGAFDEVLFVVKATYTADANTNIRIGITDHAQANFMGSGFFIERLAADTAWWGAALSGAKTRTSNSLMADGSANGAWLRFKIRRISSGNWGFSINDGTEEVVSSGTPAETTSVLPTLQQWNTSGTNTITLLADYFHLKLTPRTR